MDGHCSRGESSRHTGFPINFASCPVTDWGREECLCTTLLLDDM